MKTLLLVVMIVMQSIQSNQTLQQKWEQKLLNVPATTKQKIFINKTIDNLDRLLSKDNQKLLNEFSQEASKLFNKSEQKIIFGTLEDYRIVKAKMLFADCECNTYSQYCGDQICIGGTYANCDTTTIGCGFLLMYQCDGRCVVAP